MTKGEDFNRKRKCKVSHCSSLLNSAWCDLKSKGNISKLHDNCPNLNCNRQKVITFTPHQYMLEGGLIKSKLRKVFRGTKKAWDKFIKPCIKMSTPLISAAVAAKTMNLQSAQMPNNILKPLTGGKQLSLTAMHGRGFRLKVI